MNLSESSTILSSTGLFPFVFLRSPTNTACQRTDAYDEIFKYFFFFFFRPHVTQPACKIFARRLQEKVWCHCCWTADCWSSCLQAVVRSGSGPHSQHASQIRANAVGRDEKTQPILHYCKIKSHDVCRCHHTLVLTVILLKFRAALCQVGCWKGSGIICICKYCRCELYIHRGILVKSLIREMLKFNFSFLD